MQQARFANVIQASCAYRSSATLVQPRCPGRGGARRAGGELGLALVRYYCVTNALLLRYLMRYLLRYPIALLDGLLYR